MPGGQCPYRPMRLHHAPAVGEAGARLTATVARLAPPFPWTALPPETALVGGVVRDALLGRLKTNPDLDLTVPWGAIRLCHHLAEHWGGTVVVLDQVRDIGRLVHGDWVVDVAAWHGATMEEDLWRRDFTINAMAYHLQGQAIHDPCGGLQDLAQGHLRSVAAANLAADPLRVLRAYRLAAELEVTIEEGTCQWLHQEAPGLEVVAWERITGELERLCRAPQGHHWLVETGTVLQRWLPMVKPWPGLNHLSHQLATTLGLGGKPLIDHLTMARFSALLGSEPGVKRLGRSQRQQRQWQWLNHWRQAWIGTDTGLEEDQQLQLHLNLAEELPVLLLILLAQEQLSMEKARCWLSRWQNPADPLCHPRCPISGHGLQEALALPSGPHLGALMAFLRHEYAFGRLVPEEEAILSEAREWLKKGKNN